MIGENIKIEEIELHHMDSSESDGSLGRKIEVYKKKAVNFHPSFGTGNGMVEEIQTEAKKEGRL